MISNDEYSKLLDQQFETKTNISANKIIPGTILKISDRKQEISALLFECILFKAMSGFVSRADQTRVYNSYKYNIKTNQLIKTTNNPFFYGG